jgi:hypothetical protein
MGDGSDGARTSWARDDWGIHRKLLQDFKVDQMDYTCAYLHL